MERRPDLSESLKKCRAALKRTVCICMIAVLLFCIVPTGATAEIRIPTRIVNVVYDDSGSMYSSVNAWCQAKYSMEVFAAMLRDMDTMNVYYMSDYEQGTTAGPRIVLSGRDGIAANVAKIHDQKTTALNTPFDSVRKAYADLDSSVADEKWLVILTDGAFEDGKVKKEEVDRFFAQKSSDIKVMFLGMGSAATGITEVPGNDVYYSAAPSPNDILSKITDICTRVFNINKLEVTASSKTVSFDVPMGELTVFAQGANVAINGIKRSDGSLIQSSITPVEVKYSQCDAVNYSNAPNKNLLGKVVTFIDDFPAGNYTVDVSGAETLEVYYKPNVEVRAVLTDKGGDDVTDLSSISAGDYTIKFDLVKAGTDEPVPTSKLLGDVTYEASVTNNGELHDKAYKNGDSISIEEGGLSIDVVARYLEYNSVTTRLDYDIYDDKEFTFSVINSPGYSVSSEELIGDEPLRFVAEVVDGELTDAQWESMEVPEVRTSKRLLNFQIGFSEVTKTDETGVFEVRPLLPDGTPSGGPYKDTELKISYRQKVGSEVWQGSGSGTLKLEDTRPWWEQNRSQLVKFAVSLAILLFIAGYLPPIKKYLPSGKKGLKPSPIVMCYPQARRMKPIQSFGSVEKDLCSTIIPYIPQTGTIHCITKSAGGCPPLKVRAMGKRRMMLTNAQVFAGNKDITFNGMPINEGIKKYKIGAGVTVEVKCNGMKYVCTLNV